MKKLYKNRQDRIIFGVIGGIGEYFNIDPTILRLVTIFFTVFTGVAPMVIIYILAALVIPSPISVSSHK